MINFWGIGGHKRFKKLSESEMMELFDSYKNNIFCTGDINICDENIEWIHANSTVRINWPEINKIYVSSESGSNNINIESADNRKISFYINNRNNSRDKFLKYLQQFAALKGADITS